MMKKAIVVWQHSCQMNEVTFRKEVRDEIRSGIDGPKNVVSVFPEIKYIRDTNWDSHFHRHFPTIDDAISKAKSEYGNVPLIHIGYCKGAVTSLLYAQNTFANQGLYGSFFIGVGMTIWKSKTNFSMGEGLPRLLSQNASDNPFGIWLYGKKTIEIIPSEIDYLHSVAGNRQSLRYVDFIDWREYSKISRFFVHEAIDEALSFTSLS